MSLAERTTPTAIFTDPLLGTPLQVYIHKDVSSRAQLATLLTVHGGALATSISNVTFIIVDPTRESGQAIYRQYGPKNKLVLTARWIHACIEAQALQLFQTSWAGCKVTGTELVPSPPPQAQVPSSEPSSRPQAPFYPYSQQAEAGPSRQPVYFSPTQGQQAYAPQVQSSALQHSAVAQQSPNLPPQLSPHVLAQPLSSVRAIGQPYPHLTQPPTGALNAHQHLHSASGHAVAHFPAPDLVPQPQAQTQPQTFSFYSAQTSSTQPPYVQWQPVQQVQQQQHHFAHSQPPHTAQTASHPNESGLSHAQVQNTQMQIRRPDIQDLSHPPPNRPPEHNFQNASPHGYDHQTQTQSGAAEWQPMPPAQVEEYEWAHHEPQQQAQVQNEYQYYPTQQPEAYEYVTPYNESAPASMAPEPEPTPSACASTPPMISASPLTPLESELEPEPSRGRKRKRPVSASQSALNTYAAPPTLTPCRSPTPPTQILPSPYGGNIFTEADQTYLTRYIDYCAATSQILSLKEVCEKVAQKATHHTVASWKRFANKKGFAVGEYAVRADEARGKSGMLPPAPHIGEGSEDEEEEEGSGREPSQPYVVTPEPGDGGKRRRGRGTENSKETDKTPASRPGQGVLVIAAARARVAREGPRSRSPTPPRALFRSTTGKGVAFTDGDVVFLLRFLEYWRSKPGGTAHDKSEFWTELARRAPHHSKTSWTKFYRRHLDALIGTAPPPPPAGKRLRYSTADDVLLARFWADPNKPSGASDVIYQGFARIHPHHPWKGWQEHARVHKKRIEELVDRIGRGENVEAEIAEEDA